MPMFNKRQKPSAIVLPQPLATLPFDLKRTGSFPRDPRIMGALMRGPNAATQAETTWLPQRMAVANRWKIGQTSSALASPGQAVQQSGSILRQTRNVHVPGGVVDQIHQRANALTASMQHQMRPPTLANTPQGATINNMSQASPQVGDRIDPSSLSQDIQRSQYAGQTAVGNRAARKGAAITSAMQSALWGNRSR